MRYFSMFSGIGGFELGIGDKHKCIGFSEIDQYAIKIYQKHFKGHKNYGDARRIVWEEVEDFDLLCGGFPCQAFSIAGKRGGFKDTRGTLFFEIARAVSAKRPSLLLLENVKGLLSHDNGNTFGTILTTLSDLGYFCEWQVLNSKDFGVPQNRERVFIVGHLGEEGGQTVFPIAETGGEPCKIFGRVTGVKGHDYLRRVYDKEYSSPTVTTKAGGGHIPKIVASRGRNPDNPSDRTTGAPTEQRLETNEQGTTNTLTSVGKDNWVMEEEGVRRLTPLEYERLQGFPDGWTEGISETQRYNCGANAVTVNVIQTIMEKML